MHTRKKNRNPHMTGFLLDLTHIVLCVGVVVLAVMIFLNPVRYRQFFPLVFLASSLMQFLHGVPKIVVYRKNHGADRKVLAVGVGICILGVILAALAAVSAITIWR
ncbi:MAG: hypothetical protein HFI38_13855 [Lachnospiraceae bacterium]|jgi:hypothetical protein|nr:hypothetical protein [Lachnospiraceae bacterium]